MTDNSLNNRLNRRVVCAALRKDGRIIIGPRHFDTTMQREIKTYKGWGWEKSEQGFIDQWGNFMDRKEAFEVATTAEQIIKKTGNPESKELFSEDLY